MKKLIFILLIAAATKRAKAQTEGVLDTLVYLQSIVANKAQFVGMPFSKLMDSLKIQIKFFSPTSGIPYNTIKETSTHFGFYFPRTSEEMYLTYPHLIIYWQPYLNAEQSRMFYKASIGWTSTVSSYYSSGIIADIRILE